MSKLSIMVMATVASFTAIPVGKHTGTIVGIEEVYTKPEKSKSPWQDASRQLAFKIKSEDGTMNFYQPMSAFVRDTDTEEIDMILANMSKERLDDAKISATAWKNLKTREAKLNAMFDIVPSDQFNASKANYIVFKHGDKVRVESEARYEKDILPILGRIPTILGLAQAGEEFDLADAIDATTGFEVIEGPNGKNKISRLITVEEATA